MIGVVALAVAAAVCMTSFAAVVSGKGKIRRVGTSMQVETSQIQKGKRGVVVTGVVQSSVPRCERQRSVLLYEVGPTGDFVGGAIGHGVTQGGAQRGQVTIDGVAPKKIKPDRSFRMEAVGRKVKVKGKELICKRGVSVMFPGDFG
ncbi:MAG TPA: hypothetical protein VFN15_01800 [Solirubrobacterales bacterium]|nr:hypothetical protein [Solirubrobacterales bacterium]